MIFIELCKYIECDLYKFLCNIYIFHHFTFILFIPLDISEIFSRSEVIYKHLNYFIHIYNGIYRKHTGKSEFLRKREA